MSEEKYSDITSTVYEGLTQIMPENLVSFAKWLIDNEGDIAYDMRDYGELKGIFEDVIERKPLRGNLSIGGKF